MTMISWNTTHTNHIEASVFCNTWSSSRLGQLPNERCMRALTHHLVHRHQEDIESQLVAICGNVQLSRMIYRRDAYVEGVQ